MTNQEIISAFESNTLTDWHHRQHIIITISCALTAYNIAHLTCVMRCKLIMFRTKSSPDYTTKTCEEKYSQTVSSFWIFLIWHLVEEHKGKTIDELVEIADKKGFLDKDIIYDHMLTDYLDTFSARAENTFTPEDLAKIKQKYFPKKIFEDTLQPGNP